jgi:succinate-semialdehyde dehydrogenase / glutarate-semialdehyde dehydrogenase
MSNQDFPSRDPYTGDLRATIAGHSSTDVDARLDAVHAGRKNWSSDRARRIEATRAIGRSLAESREQLALLMTEEMGKTLTEARKEADKCVRLCEHYAERAEEYLASEALKTDTHDCFVFTRPLGTVLGVMPWNYPFWQAMRFIVPTLLAGNTAVLKHAANIPRCALAIEERLRHAGIDDSVFSILLVGSGEVKSLIQDDRISAVSITGSEGAGRAVAAAAGEALKPSLLELGGCDPLIVLEDADVEAAAEAAVASRFLNSGQSCIAAKRFLVVASQAERFEAEIAERTRRLVTGDPKLDDTDLGPLAKSQGLDDCREAIDDALRAGGRLLIEGGATGHGNGFAPAVVADVNSSMLLGREEVFGPVAAIRSVRDEDEAIRIANETRFGLGASLWTADRDRALSLAARLEVGLVAVNTMVASDPAVPFGGVKASGYGRELGAEGTRAFGNRQSLVIAD